jgi:3-deoxy-D-manno-octulosonic-acid transferase
MIFLYFIILNAVLLLALPFILGRSLSDRKFREDLKNRITGEINAPNLEKCIWIHASSVGETKVAITLWNQLKTIDTIPTLVLSTFTESGYKLAVQEKIEPVFRLPPDHPIWINPLVNKLNPSILILIESEFWPCLLWRCAKLKIPVLLANGRISERSYNRYSKIAGLFRKFIEPINFFAMRSQTDANRIEKLGISLSKIEATGNIKFESLIKDETEPPSNTTEDSKLIVFGSTRPGEEEYILETIKEIRKQNSETKFAIAPRHINRRSEIESLFSQFDLPYCNQSKIKEKEPIISHIVKNHISPGETILIDTLGDLTGYYQNSCISFVGGGFNPEFGGQNILEPAAYKKPVIFGPHMKNFDEEAELLYSGGGGIKLDSLNHLTKTIEDLLKDKKKRETIGNKAWELLNSKQGAIDRHIKKIVAMIS